MNRIRAKRQSIVRRQHHFRLDPTNEARLARMSARYRDLLGCGVSLSLLIPRALMALENELDAFPISLAITPGTDPLKPLRDSELKTLNGLCP